jgi:hypothetical protein
MGAAMTIPFEDILREFRESLPRILDGDDPAEALFGTIYDPRREHEEDRT